MAAHEDLTPKHHFAGPSDFSFGLVAAAVFCFMGVWPVLRHRPARFWAIAIGAACLCLACVRPGILHPINVTWMKLAMLVNRFVTPIITAILFFGLITPVAFLFRLGRRDVLRMNRDPEASTYWIDRQPPGPAPHSMDRPF